MHNILEIAIGVGLGMTIFLVIIWLLGTVVYICCGKNKKIVSVRNAKVMPGNKSVESQNEVIEEVNPNEEIKQE